MRVDNSSILFIINPNSGAKRVRRILRDIRSISPPVSYVVTKDLDHLHSTFTDSLEKFTLFVMVGGDGTVNESVKYLSGRKDKLLGVISTGSGNGFAHELGFGKNVKKLMIAVQSGETMDLDTLQVGGHQAINIAGVGIDSFVAHEFSKTVKRGFGNYVLIALKSVIRFTPFKAAITVDGRKIEGLFRMISFANTRQFGNHALVAPGACPNDGKIELVLLRTFPFILYLPFVIRMFTGTLKNSKYLEYISTEGPVTLESDYNDFHIDGDPVRIEGAADIKISKSTLRAIKMPGARIQD